MSEHEIARRCSHCGASIRVRAFFCPQCGGQLRGEQLGVNATSPGVQSETSAQTQTLAEGVREEATGTPAVEVQQQSKANNLPSAKKQRKRARRRAKVAAQAQKVTATDEDKRPLATAVTAPDEDKRLRATTAAVIAPDEDKKSRASTAAVTAPDEDKRSRATTAAVTAPDEDKRSRATTAVTAPDEDKRSRATTAAQDLVADSVLPRVEKLRKVSSVVFDEVAYDPSFRFVLVAALLFVIFLAIVVLSKLIN